MKTPFDLSRALAVRSAIFILFALAIAGFLTVRSCQTASTAKTAARLSENQATAAIESGADAVATVGQAQAAEVRIDVITRENERAIREAPGASAPVDPALHAAGIASLCRRAAYRGNPECVQQADPE